MRFLLETAPPPPSAPTDALVAAGQAARCAGLDGVLVTAAPALPAPLVAAAALAGAVEDILVAAEVPLGDRHPLEVAEEAVVVDLASGGRLVLVTRPAPGCEEDYAEALDLVRTALAPAPFEFRGRRWRVPAGLEQNLHNRERRTRVTPAPARPRIELWSAGPGGEAGLARGLGHLADAHDDPERLAAAWADQERKLGPAAIGSPRGRRMPWLGADALVAKLEEGRRLFGQDWAAVAAPAEDAAELGHRVRPRVQLDRLPVGLEEHWARAGSGPFGAPTRSRRGGQLGEP